MQRHRFLILSALSRRICLECCFWVSAALQMCAAGSDTAAGWIERVSTDKQFHCGVADTIMIRHHMFCVISINPGLSTYTWVWLYQRRADWLLAPGWFDSVVGTKELVRRIAYLLSCTWRDESEPSLSTKTRLELKVPTSLPAQHMAQLAGVHARSYNHLLFLIRITVGAGVPEVTEGRPWRVCQRRDTPH